MTKEEVKSCLQDQLNDLYGDLCYAEREADTLQNRIQYLEILLEELNDGLESSTQDRT